MFAAYDDKNSKKQPLVSGQTVNRHYHNTDETTIFAMAATIVYEGVGGGGELFSGIKFFLLQRIPTRNHFKDLIVVCPMVCGSGRILKLRQANGGEVVPLEKQADIVIGDHARKDQPEGSISWTFIESSIRNGRVEDVENHRAGPITRAVRQVGSAQPTKKGRTPFTPEDDRVLTKWCASAERKGLSLKGNEIYQQLEAIVRLTTILMDIP